MERMKIEDNDGINEIYLKVTIQDLEEENKNLNKKIEKLQIEIGGLMGERDGLQMVVERLHKEIAEQEAEGHGLFDEIEYRKRECKKLKEELSKNKVERWSLKKDCENKIEQQKIALRSMENQIRELKETLDHRDSFFSIMRDVLANEEIDNTQLAAILYCVVHEECGDYDLSEKELEVVKKFWNRDYV